MEFDFDIVAALHERVLLQTEDHNLRIPQPVGGGLSFNGTRGS